MKQTITIWLSERFDSVESEIPQAYKLMKSVTETTTKNQTVKSYCSTAVYKSYDFILYD